VSRPAPLSTIIAEVATTSGADSALRAYRSLREKFLIRGVYDFGEPTLNIAAFRLGRAQTFDEAFALLKLRTRTPRRLRFVRRFGWIRRTLRRGDG